MTTEHERVDPITPETAAAQEEWWDRSLSSAGRGDILTADHLKLPAKILWRHMSPEARAAVDHMRPSEFRPEDRGATPEQEEIPLSPQEMIRQLNVENSLLRSHLWMTARRLQDYQDAPHFEIEEDNGHPMLEVVIPASLREKSGEALEKAHAMLKEPDKGRGR